MFWKLRKHHTTCRYFQVCISACGLCILAYGTTQTSEEIVLMEFFLPDDSTVFKSAFFLAVTKHDFLKLLFQRGCGCKWWPTWHHIDRQILQDTLHWILSVSAFHQIILRILFLFLQEGINYSSLVTTRLLKAKTPKARFWVI